MKKYTLLKSMLLLSMALILTSQLNAQVYHGNLLLNTQAKVDAFNYTEIDGNLWIGGNSDSYSNIDNLDNLAGLTNVGGHLNIRYDNDLTRLDGLQDLITVGGNFYILSLLSLNNIDSLHNLITTGGDMYLSGCNLLPNINGLQSLTSVGNDLQISSMLGITNINGLQSLTSVGNDLEVISMDGITNIDSLHNLTSVSGDMTIFNNHLLTNIDGLKNLTTVGGWLTIQTNYELKNIDGLQSLTYIGGNLSIFRLSRSLKDFDALSNLTTVGGNVYFYESWHITRYCGLYPLLSGGGLGGTFRADITQQQIIDDGPCSAYCPESLYLYTQEQVDGVDCTGTIEDLIIQGEDITDLSPLMGLTGLTGDLYIQGTALSHLDGLQNINFVGKNIYITSNENLTSLNVLQNIDSAHRLNISTNANLPDLDGLQNLKYVGTQLSVYNNGNLTNLDALQALVSVGSEGGRSGLSVFNNSLLSDFCGLFPLFDGSGFSGYYNITNNLVNPTQQEILDEGPCCVPPELNVISTPITLWPPNHKYETIEMIQLVESVVYECDDLSFEDVYITKVSSDEPENGSGDGNTENDIVIDSDCSSVKLRKERDGNGNGRVYTINLAVDDIDGNPVEASVKVFVPLSKKGSSVDDGVYYEEECSKSSLVAFSNDNIKLTNYPNPFNGSTTIAFTVAETDNTTIRVYDSYGKEVATLFNGIAESGQKYSLDFNAGNLPKGMYVYHLVSGNNVSVVKKMILMK